MDNQSNQKQPTAQDKQVKAMLDTLAKQRDMQSNQVVELVGQMSLMQDEIEKLQAENKAFKEADAKREAAKKAAAEAKE